MIFILVIRGVRSAVWFGFEPFLALHFAVQFSQNHNNITPHFCSHMCGAVYMNHMMQFE